ncbi:hypothetical protein FKM82_017275 [Ascaphus truei]
MYPRSLSRRPHHHRRTTWHPVSQQAGSEHGVYRKLYFAVIMCWECRG